MLGQEFVDSFANRYIWSQVINNERQHYIQKSERELYNPFTLDSERGLTITARRRDATNENFTQQQYLSGLISTHGQSKGILPPTSEGARHISALLSLPIGAGVWPAWWFLPEFVQWPERVRVLPEIDALEAIGEGGRYYSTVHTYGVDNPDSNRDVLNQDQYTHNCPTVPLNEPHWYHFYRDAQYMRFGFDDEWTKTVLTPPDLQGPLHFNLNLAVGGNWPESVTGAPTLDRYEFSCERIDIRAVAEPLVVPNRDVIARLERLREETTNCVNNRIDIHIGELR